MAGAYPATNEIAWKFQEAFPPSFLSEIATARMAQIES